MHKRKNIILTPSVTVAVKCFTIYGLQYSYIKFCLEIHYSTDPLFLHPVLAGCI